MSVLTTSCNTNHFSNFNNLPESWRSNSFRKDKPEAIARLHWTVQSTKAGVVRQRSQHGWRRCKQTPTTKRPVTAAPSTTPIVASARNTLDEYLLRSFSYPEIKLGESHKICRMPIKEAEACISYI